MRRRMAGLQQLFILFATIKVPQLQLYVLVSISSGHTPASHGVSDMNLLIRADTQTKIIFRYAKHRIKFIHCLSNSDLWSEYLKIFVNHKTKLTDSLYSFYSSRPCEWLKTVESQHFAVF